MLCPQLQWCWSAPVARKKVKLFYITQRKALIFEGLFLGFSGLFSRLCFLVGGGVFPVLPGSLWEHLLFRARSSARAEVTPRSSGVWLQLRQPGQGTSLPQHQRGISCSSCVGLSWGLLVLVPSAALKGNHFPGTCRGGRRCWSRAGADGIAAVAPR